MDRAALDAALEAGLEVGGWVPLGRRAEDGPVGDKYPLKETESAEYPVRTERNVVEADATVILSLGPLSGGTLLTVELCRRHGRPHAVVPLDGGPARASAGVLAFLASVRPAVLNVAGPRESKSPGVYRLAKAALSAVFGRPRGRNAKLRA